MTKHTRIGIVALVGVAAIGAVGLTYKYCVQPREPVWAAGASYWPTGRTPLVVGGDEARAPGVATAADAWNHAAGCVLFHVAPDAADPDVVVVAEGEVVGEARGDIVDLERAYLVKAPDGTTRARVELINVVGPDVRHCAAAHGFGHVLGLAHDEHTASIMHPRACENAGAFPASRPTDKDGAALRDAYCRRRP
jgi:hypothetical protein